MFLNKILFSTKMKSCCIRILDQVFLAYVWFLKILRKNTTEKKNREVKEKKKKNIKIKLNSICFKLTFLVSVISVMIQKFKNM